MIPQYQTLSERLAYEWQQARKAAQKAIEAHASGHRYAGEAIALNLHSFYVGVERIFTQIAQNLDGRLPQGGAWHRELLLQMTLAIRKIRPAVIQKETQIALQDFLNFRHLIRNVYTWDLDAQKLTDLVDKLGPTLALLEADLKAFLQFLEAASRADEES